MGSVDGILDVLPGPSVCFRKFFRYWCRTSGVINFPADAFWEIVFRRYLVI